MSAYDFCAAGMNDACMRGRVALILMISVYVSCMLFNSEKRACDATRPRIECSAVSNSDDHDGCVIPTVIATDRTITIITVRTKT